MNEAKSGNVMIDRPIVDKIDEEIRGTSIKRIWTVADVEVRRQHRRIFLVFQRQTS